jgi:hypothetical protein
VRFGREAETVGRREDHPATRAEDAMNFVQRRRLVADVFDHVPPDDRRE